MKKIIITCMGLVLLGAFSACGGPLEEGGSLMNGQSGYTESGARNGVEVRPGTGLGTDAEETSPVGAPEYVQRDEVQKVAPSQPVGDNAVAADASAPSSADDLAKAAQAYESGDSALCAQIADENLKRQCLEKLATPETPLQEEFKSIVTPGTP